jgi:hypothetical protein
MKLSSSLGAALAVVSAGSLVLAAPAEADPGPRVATGPAVAAAPAVDPNVPDPNDPNDRISVLTGIARRKGRRVVSAIRQDEHDVPAIIAADANTKPDGSVELLVAYEISLFNQCVFEQPHESAAERRAARESCAEVRGVSLELRHYAIAPTPRGRTEDVGGAIELVGEADYGERLPRSGGVVLHALGHFAISPTETFRYAYVTRAESEYVPPEYRGEQRIGTGSTETTFEQMLYVYDDELIEVDSWAVSTDAASEDGAQVTFPTDRPQAAVRNEPARHRVVASIGAHEQAIDYATLREPVVRPAAEPVARPAQ